MSEQDGPSSRNAPAQPADGMLTEDAMAAILKVSPSRLAKCADSERGQQAAPLDDWCWRYGQT